MTSQSPAAAPNADAPTVGVASIRALGPGDLGIARDMLSQRDDRAWTDKQTEWFLLGLDPNRCRAWAAMDGDRPAGLTSYFIRDVVWRGETRRLAYWANLYVDPDYRGQMLYPRLPMTMLRSLGDAGCEFLYAAVRLQDVAQAHTGMGFGVCGEKQVLVRPLRPGRFLIKHKRLPGWLKTIAAPADALFGWGLNLRSRGAGCRIEDVSIADAPLDAIAAMLQARSTDQLAQSWTEDLLAERYAQTREGGDYRCLVAYRDDQVAGALIYRDAERGAGIRVAVVMDVVDNGSPAMARGLFAQLDAIAGRAGAEIAMLLDGLGESIGHAARAGGYRQAPEKYTLMVYPKKKIDEHDWLAGGNWEYSFRDHDAF